MYIPIFIFYSTKQNYDLHIFLVLITQPCLASSEKGWVPALRLKVKLSEINHVNYLWHTSTEVALSLYYCSKYANRVPNRDPKVIQIQPLKETMLKHVFYFSFKR